MSYTFYYPKTVHNISIAFMNVFKDFVIHKYESVSGTSVQTISVPLLFNQPEKAYQWLMQNHYFDSQNQEHGKRFYLELPRMSLNFNSISYAADRATGVNETREWLKESLDLSGYDANQILKDINPAPYNLGYTLYIRTDSIDQLSQILENFLPYFNPKISLRVKEFSFLNIERDILIGLDSISPTIPIEIPETDIRQIACDINFTIEAFMYRPFTYGKIIKYINSRYYTNVVTDDISLSATSAVSATSFEISEYSTSGFPVTSAGYNTSAIPEDYLTSGSISDGRKNYIWELSGTGFGTSGT